MDTIIPAKSIAFIDAGQFRPAVITARLGLPSNRRFDWSRFVDYLKSIGDPVYDFHYFDCDEGNTRQASFHAFLKNTLGFQLHFTELREKQRHCSVCDARYQAYEQGGVDVSIAVSMMMLAQRNAFEHAILCSGDGDFAPLVNTIRNSFGKRVTVLGWSNGVAPALRDAATRTITLNDHLEEFIGVRSKPVAWRTDNARQPVS